MHFQAAFSKAPLGQTYFHPSNFVRLPNTILAEGLLFHPWDYQYDYYFTQQGPWYNIKRAILGTEDIHHWRSHQKQRTRPDGHLQLAEGCSHPG